MTPIDYQSPPPIDVKIPLSTIQAEEHDYLVKRLG